MRGRRIADPSTGWSRLLQLTLLVMPLIVAMLPPLPLILLLLLPRVMRCRRVEQAEAEEEAEKVKKTVPFRHAKPDDDDEEVPEAEAVALPVV